MQVENHKKEGPLAKLLGPVDEPKDLTLRLEYAAKQFHLVAPQTAVGFIPEGCSVGLSAVTIDVDHETYPIPGSTKVGLGKVALDRIAAAAGISWDPRLSGRLDDASDPHYCRYRAVGIIRDFDGAVRQIVGEKEVDVRDGSPQVAAIIDRCIAKARKSNSGADAERRGRLAGETQIREIRLHILAHAETKARLRAIRTLGIRTTYAPEELQKPFVVAKIVWTGRTDDPELRREFARVQQLAMLGAGAALFGAPSTPSVAEAALRTKATPPPPVGAVVDAWDDDSGVTEAPETKAEAGPGPRSHESHQTQAAFVIPGGRAKGTPLSKADERDLTYWHKRIGEELEAGTSKFPERDEDLFEALDDELRRRRGEPESAPQSGSDESADFRDDEVY